MASEESTPQDSLITRNGVELTADLAPAAIASATLDFGTPVEIVDSYRTFVHVRAPDGREGWTSKSMLIDLEMQRSINLLKEQAASSAGQGRVHALDTLNVHVEPYRWSPTLYQLQKDEVVETLRKQLVARLPHKPVPNKPSPEPEQHDDWYLVRLANGYSGWLLAGRTYSGIPTEIAQYAEGRRITSYFEIGQVYDSDSDEAKATWLWTQVTGPNQPYDFDRLRVFQWKQNRHAYATIKLETGFIGYLPVTLIPAFETDRGTGVGFSILVSKDERRFVRKYVHVRNRVYRISEEPAPEIPEPIKIEEVEPPPQPLTLMEKVKNFLTFEGLS